MKKIAVIGGCGYIGTYLCRLLHNAGHYVESVDLEWFGNYHRILNTKKDFAGITSATWQQFDTVILLAGHSSVKMCVDNLQGTFQNNVANFVNLLPKLRGKQFIYASSSSIYGNINRSLMDEECPEYRSGNFYDLSKYEIDSYVKLFEGCEYYGLRFGTVNGPSPNFRTDIMINAMYVSALNNKHIRINNPHIRRPILGIKDLGRAVLSIIKNGTDAKRGIYNLASFNSTVELIGRHVSDYMDVPLEFTPDSPNVYDFAISTKKFEQAFDFTFQETVKTIITDIRQQHEHLRFTHRNKIIPYPQDE